MSPEFDYKQYLDLVRKWKYPAIAMALLVMTVAVVMSYVLPEKFEAKSTVFIEKNVISELIKGIAVSPSKDDAIKVIKYTITSRPIILKVLTDLDLTTTRAKTDDSREELIRELQKNIGVAVKDNNLFTITFSDTDPKVARDFVNTLVQRWIEENISSKREESYGAIKFLSEQIETFKQKLDESDAALTKYKAEKGGVVNVDQTTLLEGINESQQKLYDLQLRRQQLEALRPVARRASDPLHARLTMLQKHLEQLRVEYTDSYPEVVKVKTDIENTREQMRKRSSGSAALPESEEVGRVTAELSALRMSEANLQGYIARSQALLKSIPAVTAGMEKLEMERQSRKDLYDKLLARQGQSEVSKQMEVQDKTTTFRIIDPAIMSTFPASPDRVMLILLGVVAGLAAGLGLAILLDKLDHSVKSVDMLKKLGVPVLAAIPTIRNPEELAQRRQRDNRVFLAAGAYFCLVLVFLAVEIVRRFII